MRLHFPRTVTIRRGGQMPMAGKRFADLLVGDRFCVEWTTDDPEAEKEWAEVMEVPTPDEDGIMGVVVKFPPKEIV